MKATYYLVKPHNSRSTNVPAELSRFKNRDFLDTPWKKATAVTICIGLLAAIVVFPVLHSTGYLGRIWSVYHAPQSSVAKDMS